MTIYEKLLHVQQNLKAPKGQYNDFGNYHYRSCEDIQEAVKPLLAEVKVLLLTGDEIVQIGNRFYIKATVVFQDTESPEKIINTAYARETEECPKMDGAQLTGSASSYARKYALNGLFCIDDSKDPDVPMPNQKESKNPERQQQPKQNKNQSNYQGKAQNRQQSTRIDLSKLCKEAERTGTSLSKVCERYSVQDIRQLNLEQYQRAMSAFAKMESLPPPSPEQQFEFDFSKEGLPFR